MNIPHLLRLPVHCPLLLGAVLLSVLGCSAASKGKPALQRISQPLQPGALPALPVEPAQHAAAPNRNPFQHASFYIDPNYVSKVDVSRALAPELDEQMQLVKQQPTALWLDRIAAVEALPNWLDDAQAQGDRGGRPTLPVVVVYNLPNRDCAAKASHGELEIAEDGERRYRQEYIDVIARHLAAMPQQEVVVVLEPDSLPNLISNLGVEKCALSHDVYIHSIAYAVARLSLPHVSIYLDAAHAGWLGWEANQRRMARLVKQVLSMAGGAERIRGFATNVSNYNALRGDWGRKLEATNPSPNELAFVAMFAETLAREGITDKGFLVDTSRNGQASIRSRWGNWCNIKGAGLGERPAVAPVPGVDAYFWIKPPGDSDGTADESAARFDDNCASADATPGAPEAGQWFHSYFVELVKRAEPPL